jgi:DNA-binding FrmR family transcriptional regulator
MQAPKDNIIHRLKIARGHLDKVIRMVEKDEYCIAVVHQSLAVQAALKKTDEAVLEHHLKTCVTDSIRKGEANDVVGEIMQVLQKK